MSHPEFSEGVCNDGAAILRDGQPLTVSEILALLRQGTESDQRIRELEAENVRLNKRYDILAMHMAEVKAIADGCHMNTLGDVVEHCLKALEELPR